MIEAEDFIDRAREWGFSWYAAVPCSFLTPFINRVINDERLDYLSSSNEGDAVAAAVGAAIGGRRSVAMMQNSGLGNAVNPLTSLAWIFRIPVLIICTHRGEPGLSDEPQHELMGAITGDLFERMQIPWEVFPDTAAAIKGTLRRVDEYLDSERRPYALLMKKGTVAKHPLSRRAVPEPRLQPADRATFTGGGARATRSQALERVLALTAGRRDTVVIATTGYTGRELYALDDRPNHLYMVGSMGCASSLGLGLALVRPDLRVVIIDGDGAALMRLGNFATCGTYGGGNLVHLLLDNEVHDSTGAQATVSAGVQFADIAAACGYARTMSGDGLELIDDLLDDDAGDGPRFGHLKIQWGTIANLPRPADPPAVLLDRLRRHIGEGGLP
jgi:phosphonopyruvate decarboxylase